MALSEYKKKRKFSDTPEPEGGKSSDEQLQFVIQKHKASHLHYDFRLELRGVLKSWAVPKGPSTDPDVKRLAMLVEDHPFDYKDFEGIIPEGNYGAGTVIIWDQGTYEPLEEAADKKSMEKELTKQFHAGRMQVVLKGKKLKGIFNLVKISAKGENAWLLSKSKDKFASKKEVTKLDKSVVSKKTIETMTKNPVKEWKSNRAAKITKTVKKTSRAKKAKPAAKKTAKKKAGPLPGLEEAPKKPMPKFIPPMLATLVEEPFEQEGWVYEIKWDGYRALAFCEGEKVRLLSRNNKSFDEQFYPVLQAMQEWNINAVVDGEICVLNDKGAASFGSLQNWRSEADGALIYYVFDLLWLNGYDLTGFPLVKRKELLKALLPENEGVRFSESFDVPAAKFLAAARDAGLEGIMGKKTGSLYITGERRTSEWVKIKSNLRQEVVIGGYTLNEGSSKPFSALLVGVYEKGKLHYTGKIGTGFSTRTQQEMLKQFKPLVRAANPFSEEPDVNKPSRFRPDPPHAAVTWLQPKLVCEVSYTEMTQDGVMRHPSFEGMRADKPAKKVVQEKAAAVKAVTRKKIAYTTPVQSTGRKTLLNPGEKTQVRKINGHEIKFTNLDKIFWPKEGYTKRDMLNYYYQVAPYILPYLKDRPQSMNRYPNGINGKSFYQKDITGKAPEWIQQEPYRTSEGEDKNFLVPANEASLLYMANAGAIEMNPWNSTIHTPGHPDWCLIDLDPSEKTTFDQVIKVAQVTKEVLDELGVTGYPKTSGSTGIHIYIPMGAKYTYDECQLFGKLIAQHVHERTTRFTSIERLVRNRDKKLYIDYLQNRPKATLAAPYSLRPKPGAPVSMPLHWEEVKKGLSIKDFTIKNAVERIKSEGDIFKPVLGKGTNLKKMLAEMNAVD